VDSVTTFLNSSGKSFVDFAAVMLVQSSLLIIVLLGLELLLQKRVRAVLRYWVWMLILVKLMLPTTLSSPTGLAYWIGDKLPRILQQKTSTGEESGITSAGLESLEVIPIREVRVFASPTSGINPPPKAVSFVEAGAAGGLSITWEAVVFLTWLAAVITMTLLLIQRMFFVRGLVAQSKDANGALADMLERCREQLGLGRPVRLKLSPVTASPSICGLFRPTILVPQALADRLDARQLKSILLHELAHIKRRDLLVSFVQTVLQIIYIYNPLLWVANAIIRKIREEAVDEMVLVAMGEEAEDYPQTLLSVSKLTFSRPALSLRLIGVAESKKALISRIEYIAGRPFPKRAKIGITGLIAIVIIAAILLPMAKAEDRDVEAEKHERIVASMEIAAVYKQLDEIVKFSKWQAEMSFGDAIEELKNSVEPPLKIVVLWKDLAENADIEQSTQTNLGPLPPVRLSFALELLLKSVSSGKAELGYAVRDGVITIATVDSLPSKLETRVYDIALLVGPPLPGGYGAMPYGMYVPGAEAAQKAGEGAKKLAQLIRETIEPDSWWDAGGEGVVRLYENRKLVMLQTREVHKKITELLGKLLENRRRGDSVRPGFLIPKNFLTLCRGGKLSGQASRTLRCKSNQGLFLLSQMLTR